jgi:large subunit ribosomal protein L16
VAFGEFGLQAARAGLGHRAADRGRRVAITRRVKRGGKVWIRVFPDKPITKKPLETRMGKGKGPPEEWVAVVRPGRILYEIEGVPEDLAKEAMALAGHKLSIRTRFIARDQPLG